MSSYELVVGCTGAEYADAREHLLGIEGLRERAARVKEFRLVPGIQARRLLLGYPALDATDISARTG